MGVRAHGVCSNLGAWGKGPEFWVDRIRVNVAIPFKSERLFILGKIP